MRAGVLLIVAVLVAALAGCGGGTDVEEDTVDGPTARATADGVETWDLTSRPTAASVGLTDGNPVATYETDEPREALYRLPDGVELPVPTRFVTFSGFGPEDDPRWTFQVRTGQLGLEQVEALHDDLLARLGLPGTAAREFAEEAGAATGTEGVTSAQPRVQLGGSDGPRVGVVARWTPSAGTGLVDVYGSWPVG